MGIENVHDDVVAVLAEEEEVRYITTSLPSHS
jgi:hypothetical protein